MNYIKSAKLTILFQTLLLSSLVYGQMSLETELRLNGKKTLEVFEDYRQVLQDSSVIIYKNGESLRSVYGIIMSADGYILTKASELNLPNEKVDLLIRVGENRVFDEVEVIATDVRWDLALLKVEATDLIPIHFAQNSEIDQGSIVLANGVSSRSKRRVRVGIISAKPREIKGGATVVMGVTLKETDGEVTIENVVDGSAADEAGLVKADIVLSVEDEDIQNRAQILEILASKAPGDKLSLKLKRAEEVITVELVLMAKPVAQERRIDDRNDQMSGRFSRRRTGFERVLQVDVQMQERSCGGPLLNLNGECLGIVIARANRAETFVLPLEEVQQVYSNLLTMSPETKNAE